MAPPTALLMRPYVAALPAELLEAAKLDGASEVRIFLQVVMPVALLTISGVIVMNVISLWREPTLASTQLVDPASKTLPVGLLAFQGQYGTNLGVEFAGLLLAAAPMIVLYFFFSRKVTSGMSIGVLQ